MLRRVQIAQRTERDAWGFYRDVWRLCEADGNLCVNWAPGFENDDPEGPLDRGGFTERDDALAFSLGIDRWRALKRLIPETVKQIDRERRALDRVPPPEPRPTLAASAVSAPERPPPVVTHRRPHRAAPPLSEAPRGVSGVSGF